MFLILAETWCFRKLNFILDIAWRVWPFDIPNEIKVFRINSYMTRVVN